MATKRDLKEIYKQNEAAKAQERILLDAKPTLVSELINDNKQVELQKEEYANGNDVLENTNLNTPEQVEKLEPENETGTMVGFGVSFTDATQDFFLTGANSKGIPLRAFFLETLLPYINNPSPSGSEFEKKFYSSQHGTYRKTFHIPEEMRDKIRQTARIYKMKPTAFVSYVFENEMKKQQKDQ